MTPMSDLIERFRIKTQLIQFTHCVRLNIDAHAKGLDICDGFEHDTVYADLMQSKRNTQTANAPAGNEYWEIIHHKGASLYWS